MTWTNFKTFSTRPLVVRFFNGPECFLWECAPWRSHNGDPYEMGWLRVRFFALGFNLYWGWHFKPSSSIPARVARWLWIWDRPAESIPEAEICCVNGFSVSLFTPWQFWSAACP